MVSISDEPISQTDWTRAISQFDDVTLLQIWAYGEAVSRSRSLDVVRVLIRRDREVIGAAQALVRRVPFVRCGVAFINRGPVWTRKDADPSELPVLLRELRRYWVE